jgi:TetR/AcrR family transcriptional repressor of nem operon
MLLKRRMPIMGRTREFDNDAVLDQATRLFWRLGYDAVTIHDIEAETGLGRGSLYNAFGDKEGLFLAVLDSYIANYGSAPLSHLDHPDVGEGIRRMFEAIVSRMGTADNPRGCLLTNTSLAAVGSSSRIEERVAKSIRAMETRLEQAIARARHEKQIPRSIDPKPLARFYCAIAQSLGVEHKAFGNQAALNDIVAIAMQTWPGLPKRAGAHPVKRKPSVARHKTS